MSPNEVPQQTNVTSRTTIEDPVVHHELPTKRILVSAVVIQLIPASFLALGVYLQWTNHTFNHNVRSVSAKLVSSPEKQLKINPNSRGLGNSHVEWRVKYEFTVNGTSYTGQGEVHSHPDRSISNDSIEVYYDATNPAHNRTKLPDDLEGVVWICVAAIIWLYLFSLHIKPSPWQHVIPSR